MSGVFTAVESVEGEFSELSCSICLFLSKSPFHHRQYHSCLPHPQWLFDGDLHRMILAKCCVPPVLILHNTVAQLLMLMGPYFLHGICISLS